MYDKFFVIGEYYAIEACELFNRIYNTLSILRCT